MGLGLDLEEDSVLGTERCDETCVALTCPTLDELLKIRERNLTK